MTDQENVMVFLGGSKQSFRCDAPTDYGRGKCGGNVFRRIGENPPRYECNSCGTTYTGERSDD